MYKNKKNDIIRTKDVKQKTEEQMGNIVLLDDLTINKIAAG